MKKYSQLIRSFICCGVYLLCIVIILLVKGTMGVLAALFPTMLFPLAVCLYSFFFVLYRLKKGDGAWQIGGANLLGLFIAGLLHFTADGIINGFYIDAGIIIYDAVVVMALVSASAFAVKIYKVIQSRQKRRASFDE